MRVNPPKRPTERSLDNAFFIAARHLRAWPVSEEGPCEETFTPKGLPAFPLRRMLRRVTEVLSRSSIRKLENAEAFPLIALQAIRELRPELEELEGAAILRAREMGASLEDIADAMGITRQGVSYRVKHLAVYRDEEGGADEEPTDEVVDLTAEESGRPRTP